MPSSQDKVSWPSTALSWNFLQCNTAVWRDPCFIWKKQNRISTILIGMPANPRPTQHWLFCTTCKHETILDPTTSTLFAPWSSWECERTVLYSEIFSTQMPPSCFLFFEKRKNCDHYFNFHLFLWHPRGQIQPGCWPVVAVWHQCCSSPYSWAPQGQNVVSGQWLLMLQYP